MAAGGEPTATMRIDGYTVDTGNVLGKGAFGVVSPATNREGKQFACKKVDFKDKLKLEEVSQGLHRLSHIDHTNIVKIFDISRSGPTLWVFMDFCENGDLTAYLGNIDLVIGRFNSTTLYIMMDIASGISYLHNKNIIHRDIKPANILISGGSPVVAKLTDFDFSKFLEEDYDTSAMTTDVGTKAFKAPEFWLRNKDEKLNYHRNVDIYAMGLTYLAMIQGNKKLVPRIETVNDDSELHQPIGAVIAERIRYKTKPLEAIPSPDAPDGTYYMDMYLKLRLRQLIRLMTKVTPEDRPCLDAVVAWLGKIIRVRTFAFKTKCWIVWGVMVRFL